MSDNNIVTRGLSGFTNLGNTCYMNSALQALASTDMLVSYLYKDEFKTHIEKSLLNKLIDEEKKKNNDNDINSVIITKKDLIKIKEDVKDTLTYKLHTLLKYYWSENCEIRPKDFKEKVDEISKHFFGTKQHDSSEFLIFLLDRIHEETKCDVKISIELDAEISTYIRNLEKMENIMKNQEENSTMYNKIKSDILQYKSNNIKHELISKSIRSWEKLFKNNYSVVNDIFSGMTVTTNKCTVCGNENHIFERLDILSLAFPDEIVNADLFTQHNKTIDIEELFRNYMKEEKINGYFCSYCKTKTEATRNIKIWHQPSVLIISISKYCRKNNNIEKINSKVRYGHTLDMDQYVSPYWKAGAEYELYGAIRHEGWVQAGHYMAYTKNLINNRWYFYNDGSVYGLENQDEVLNSNSYVLFYRKK